MGTMQDPRWWSEAHGSAWERVKAAFRRDWEQTKHDLSDARGHDLGQNVADTVKQAVGSQRAPVERPTYRIEDDWAQVEAGLRFGYGARQQYSEHAELDDRLEAKLRQDWVDLGNAQDWSEARGPIRRGWERGRAEASGSRVVY
jgi:hypothetical protein